MRQDVTKDELQASLNVATAQRDRALQLVNDLERMVTAQGGHMTHAQQEIVRDARALLVETGVRTPEDRPLWIDRG